MGTIYKKTCISCALKIGEFDKCVFSDCPQIKKLESSEERLRHFYLKANIARVKSRK